MDMSETPTGTGTIKSVETAFAIMELLADTQQTGVTDIATTLGLAKSTVHNHLKTMCHLDYVVREGDKYRLSWRFLELGEEIRDNHPKYQLFQRHTENLATHFEERAQFIVEENGRGVYLFRETGRHAVRTDSGVGKRIYLHSTAAGKAILAHMPPERIHEIIDTWGLPAVTPYTIIDEDELFAELKQIRSQGYAFNREENLERLNAVGVPVRDPNDGVLGAMSVSGPSHRFKGQYFEQEIPDFMLGLANEIELNLAYPR
ncbi:MULTISPECIES: IclR family transcriptional regulator [unclassified Haladaptatus]|uniref:IclR family transcriptional regulator n=1 Tax=unclassified Haladaptatus TaxID=2622732 RepID=UPI0023E8B797|nr:MULTISPECIES: IclR family transcriptional regulator [unclassified Haladaptatus]